MASVGVFALFAGGGATSCLHQYQYGPEAQAGQPTEISTICREFEDGEGDSLDTVRHKTRRGGIVSGLDPWAPAASFTVDLVQWVQYPSYAILFGSGSARPAAAPQRGCADLASQRTASQGQARVTVSGRDPGALLHRARTLPDEAAARRARANPPVAHYDFMTKVDASSRPAIRRASPLTP